MKGPRGTRDFLPPESTRFAAVERIGAEVFERAGFGRVITPMFEDTSLLARGVGDSTDIVNKEMYTFEDRSGNSLTLRPEGTAPVMRAVVTGNLWEAGLPIKLYYDAAMFRYERPQKGRFRQHHQLGVEVIGTEDPAADADVIAVAHEVLSRVGVGTTRLLLNSMGHPGCRDEYRPRLLAFLEEHRDQLDDDCKRRMTQNPLRVFDCKNPDDQALLADAPILAASLCGECRAHLEQVTGYLDALGIQSEPAPHLVRGFDYYTRTVFEFQSDALDAAQSTVCGGGRYDGLVEAIGGPALPGIGFGMGIERLLIAQEAAGNAAAAAGVGCYLVGMDDDARRRAMTLLAGIRARGIAAEVGLAERGMKAHFKHANRIGARAVGVIGEKEMADGVVAIKDMETGDQTEVPFDAVPDWLEEHIG